jgi:hypothetical protein
MDIDNLDSGIDSGGGDSSDLTAISGLMDQAISEVGDSPEVQPDVTPSEPTETPVVEPQEPTPDVVPAEPETSIPATPEIDPEILAIEQPRNLSEKNQSNWRKLQETATQYKKQAEEAAMLRQQLEQQVTQKPADYDELKKFRAIFDIKNDPEFHSKYTAPIKSASENIYAIMRKNGAPDDIINAIEAQGGPDKVSSDWWRQNALEKLPFTDAEKLKRSLVDMSDLREQQENEIKNAAENAEQILIERQTEGAKRKEYESNVIRETVNKITENAPWARYQQAPENATPEQIQQIQRHNAVVSKLDAMFMSAVEAQTPQERASVAAAAAYSHVLTEQLKAEQGIKSQLEARIKQLSDENSKLKSSGKMPKQVVSTQVSNKSDFNSRLSMNSMDAIGMGLDEAGA